MLNIHEGEADRQPSRKLECICLLVSRLGGFDRIPFLTISLGCILTICMQPYLLSAHVVKACFILSLTSSHFYHHQFFICFEVREV